MPRIFPNPTRDEQIAFTYHSTRIERIPLSKKDIDQTLSGSKINPFVEGQLKCLNLTKTLASNENFIPHPDNVKTYNVLDHLEWMKNLHKNMLKTVAEYGYKMNDPNLIHPKYVGKWRDSTHWVSETQMPNPFKIKQHLHHWLLNIANFHQQYKEKIEQPHLLNQQDIINLVNQTYDANLRICCIKPFQDGSNRIARLIENILRLNFGLPFKIIRFEDEFKMPYINDIKSMQINYLPD